MSTVVRRLSDVDDIVFPTGALLDALTYGTFAFLLRPLSAYTSTQRALLTLYDLGGLDLGGIRLGTDGRPEWVNLAAAVISDGPTVAASDDLYVLVIRKATGTATPRFSVRNLGTGTWTHEDGDSTVADWVAPTGGSLHTGLILGGLKGAGSDYIAVAVWANELPWSADSSGDSAVEAANLDDDLENWRDADPTALWGFGQDDNTISIEDLTPAGAADEISTGIGTPTVATDITFPYEDTGLGLVSRNHLRDTQDEPDATGIVRDLSETQGTPSTITSNNVSSGSFTEIFRWHRVVGTDVGSSVIDTQIQVTAVSHATLAYKWLVQRYDSSGVLQASSAESGEQNTTGIKVQSFILSTTWAAGDRLALSILLRKSSGGGNRTITVAVNDPDSWAEFEVNLAALEITPTALTVTTTAGTVTLTTGAVDITPAALTATATPGTLTVSAAAPGQDITPAAITVTATPGTLTLAPGTVDITPAAATVTATAGSVVILSAAGGQDITPAPTTVTATAGTVTVAAGAVDITPDVVTLTASPGTATVTTGAAGIVPAPVTVTGTAGTLTVTTGAVDITPDAMTVTVAAGTLTTTGQGGLAPAVVVVTATAGTMTVTTGPVDITPAPVTVQATAGALSAALALSLAGMSLTATPGSVTVSVGAGAITPAALTVVVTPGGVTVAHYVDGGVPGLLRATAPVAGLVVESATADLVARA
jgi:hypothetical protein